MIFFSLEKIGFTVLSHKGLRASGHLYRNVWKLGDLIRQRGPLWLFTLPSISRQVKPKGSWTSFFVLRLSGFSSRFVGMENVAHALQDQNWFWISFILTFWGRDRLAIKTVFFREFKSDNILAILNCSFTKVRLPYLLNLVESLYSSRFLSNSLLVLLLSFKDFWVSVLISNLNTLRNWQ